MMMDYYSVDTSALTKPPIVMHIARSSAVTHSANDSIISDFSALNVVGSSWVVQSFESHDVVVNDSFSWSSFSKPVSLAPTFKVVPTPVSEKQSIELIKQRLEFVYCNDEAAVTDNAQSRVALRGVVDVVEDLVDDRDYASLDSLLLSVDPTRLRAITAVAFLRSSFAVKDKLHSWNGLYQVVYAHLSNSGQNPSRALRGLSVSINQSFA